MSPGQIGIPEKVDVLADNKDGRLYGAAAAKRVTDPIGFQKTTP